MKSLTHMIFLQKNYYSEQNIVVKGHHNTTVSDVS